VGVGRTAFQAKKGICCQEGEGGGGLWGEQTGLVRKERDTDLRGKSSRFGGHIDIKGGEEGGA